MLRCVLGQVVSETKFHEKFIQSCYTATKLEKTCVFLWILHQLRKHLTPFLGGFHRCQFFCRRILRSPRKTVNTCSFSWGISNLSKPPPRTQKKKTLPPAFGIRKSCHPTIDGAIQRRHVPRERRFFGDSKNSMWQQNKGAGIESWEMNWILTNTMGTQNSFDLHYMLRSWKLAPRIKTEKYGNFVMTHQLANCTLFHFKPGKKYDLFFRM